MATGYKVVHGAPSARANGAPVLRSSGITEHEGLSRIYRRDGWTYPHERCGPLAVFEDIENANEFAARYKGWKGSSYEYEVWECEYTPSTDKNMWTWMDEPPSPDSIPDGTVLADGVRLTEQVKTEV